MGLTHEQIRNIEQRWGSPFYLFDERGFVKNYEDITTAFKSRYDKFILAYSYKTNYLPYLCNIIKEKGGWAEVVSRMEYDLALRVGQNSSRIIFNGPVKRYEDIKLALDNQSLINLDSWYEIEHINKYAKTYTDKQIKIGLRINIALSDKSGASHIQQSLKVGRFGFSPEPSNIEKLIDTLRKNKNVKIVSLHGHTSTTDRSLWCYEKITETLCDIASNYFPDTIEYINIGGGIFGHIPSQMKWAEIPCFDDYAETVSQVLKNNAWVQKKKPTLILEPGIAMAANTFSFVTKVISTKEIQDRIFVTVDGSAINTKPTFHKINPPFQVIRQNPVEESQAYNVVGSTCMEKDYLLTEVTGPKVEAGDYIKIDSVGAYTIVLTPPFINTAPAIVVKDSEDFKVIRKKQNLENMFENYLFE